MAIGLCGPERIFSGIPKVSNSLSNLLVTLCPNVLGERVQATQNTGPKPPSSVFHPVVRDPYSIAAKDKPRPKFATTGWQASKFGVSRTLGMARPVS